MNDQAGAELILQTEGITQHFKGVTALRNVDFNVRKGEIHGLVGQNGAGKSTLVKIISGLLKPSMGRVLVEGEEVQSFTPETARRVYGISVVPQQVEFFPYFSVAENIFINDFPLKRSLIDYKKLNRDAEDWFRKFGLDIDPTAAMEELSFVQQKVVLILKALKDRSKIIILDEPTASLHVAEINLLFGFIREFNKNGVTFIYISHHLDEIFEICHRVTVIRDGELQATKPVGEMDLKGLVHLMVGQNVAALGKKVRESSNEPTFEAVDLCGDQIHHLNFRIMKGEIVGILSSKGSGKEELVRRLFGLSRTGTGRLRFQGKDFSPGSPKDCFDMKICLLPDDRHRDGLFLDKPIRENTTLCSLKKVLSQLGLISRRAEDNQTLDYVERLAIKTPSVEQEVQFLSGGNQQKVLLSKILSADPAMIILDSPTVGVDIKARLEIHQIIEQISDEGISVLLLTSDLDEILSLSDRILVLVKGRIAREIRAGEPLFNARDLGFLMEGGEIDD